MKLILDDDEIEEIRIEDVIKESNDRGLIVKDHRSNEKPRRDEFEKEIIAIAALETTARGAELITGASKSSANKYSNGENVSEETRTNILDKKYNIQDKAITKLMDTLDMFDPSKLEDQRHIASAAAQMASIVDKVSGKDGGGNKVVVHFYPPNQKQITDFEVIDV